MNRMINHFAKEIAAGVLLLLSLTVANPAFAQANINPLLDNRLNPLPLARVVNTSIDNIKDAPDFHQKGRRPALILFYSSKGDQNQINAINAATNMLGLTSLEFLDQIDVYTVDNSLHPEILASYNNGVAATLTKLLWLRIVPPTDTHPLSFQAYNEVSEPVMTQGKLEVWLSQAPFVKIAATQFSAPMLPYEIDPKTKAVTIVLPPLEAAAVNPNDPAGVTSVAVLFSPEVGPSNRTAYRALTLSGVVAYRLAKKPLFYVAPKDLLDNYLHLVLNSVQPGEPQLVVLSVQNSTGKVVRAASYDPATTFSGDATKAGLQTSDLSEADVEAFIATACNLPVIDQTASLDIGKVTALIDKTLKTWGPRPAVRASLNTPAVKTTGSEQEASNFKP